MYDEFCYGCVVGMPHVHDHTLTDWSKVEFPAIELEEQSNDERP